MMIRTMVILQCDLLYLMANRPFFRRYSRDYLGGVVLMESKHGGCSQSREMQRPFDPADPFCSHGHEGQGELRVLLALPNIF